MPIPTGLCKITNIENGESLHITAATDDTPIITGSGGTTDDYKWNISQVNSVYTIANEKHGVYAFITPNTQPPPGTAMVVQGAFPGFFNITECSSGIFKLSPGDAPTVFWAVKSKTSGAPVTLESFAAEEKLLFQIENV